MTRSTLYRSTHRVPRIVLTGGPCSGKTTVIELLRQEYGSKLHYVPETASMIINQVGVNPPTNNPNAYHDFQRTLYHIQRGLETITDFQAAHDQKQAVVLDRGTVDGAAYLTGGTAQLEYLCSTSVIDHEYPHYDLILHLASPSRDVYTTHRARNPARIQTQETYEQACAAGRKLYEVWRGHPLCIPIADTFDFIEKYHAVRREIECFLNRHSH